MNNYYTYKTTNLINNKAYIGQKKGEFDRNYLGSGKILKQAIKKYGKDKFAVVLLGIASDKESVDILEKYYIAYYRQLLGKDVVYNITDGGDGGETCLGTTRIYNLVTYDNRYVRGSDLNTYLRDGWVIGMDPITRENHSKALKGKPGHLHTKNTKDKMRLSALKRSIPKVSNICKQCGKKFEVSYKRRHKKYCSKECHIKSMLGNTITLGKHWDLSEETKQKMRKPKTLEHRQNMKKQRILL